LKPLRYIQSHRNNPCVICERILPPNPVRFMSGFSAMAKNLGCHGKPLDHAMPPTNPSASSNSSAMRIPPVVACARSPRSAGAIPTGADDI
jgi:hypothetical protein